MTDPHHTYTGQGDCLWEGPDLLVYFPPNEAGNAHRRAENLENIERMLMPTLPWDLMEHALCSDYRWALREHWDSMG